MEIGLWNNFKRPPWGGGNQFMLALETELCRQGHVALRNQHGQDGSIVNSIQFPLAEFEATLPSFARVVHRVAGLFCLHRGPAGLADDERVAAFNRKYAIATVFQSRWAASRVLARYPLVSPRVVCNAVDPEIFHERGRRVFRPGRKIRLVATSWSPNLRKGGPFYRDLLDRLDPVRYVFTFVGQCDALLSGAVVYPPTDSRSLADCLRNQDIYVTASRDDACSNALLEALACGLPAAYLDSGGNAEVVGEGGLPFSDVSTCLAALERLAAEYARIQAAIPIRTIQDTTRAYLAAMTE